MVNQFLSQARGNLQHIHVADRTIAKQWNLTHSRSGKISSREPIKDARGVAIKAYGYDELGNITALCADNIIRQFI